MDADRAPDRSGVEVRRAAVAFAQPIKGQGVLRSFFRSARANTIAGWTCSLLTFMPFTNRARQHGLHHANWGQPDVDALSWSHARDRQAGRLLHTGKVVASGELRMPAEALILAAGRNDLRLFTEDRGELTVRFSYNRHKPNKEAAHIDVTDGLPPAKKWRH